MTTDYLVVDDYLTPAQADELEKLMFGNYFPWYFLDNTTTPEGTRDPNEVECPMFVHNLYFEGAVNNPGYQQMLREFRFDPAILTRMKANMLLARPSESRHTPFHVDRVDPHYTVIYYVNESDGATLIQSGQGQILVEPRKGRIVLFSGALKHANYLPARGSRCVINFNFQAYPLPGEPPFPSGGSP
ncbi:MAG: 2OG-Fe(II) oxygenase [Gammaproteobacteria bacterium]